jgi:hypothetical protein
MFRISKALAFYKPDRVQITGNPAQADWVLLHVTKSEGVLEAIQEAKRANQKVAVAQYCLRSTNEPLPFWKQVWDQCDLVWSYYDLPAPRFYHSPLGADSQVFLPRDIPKMALAMSSGYVAQSECISEVAQAVAHYSGKMFHLGPELALVGDVDYFLSIGDLQLSRLYSASHYVTGLRRGEGFELPLAEGLLCGARPVTFNQPHYRDWYGDLADYIEEGPPETVREQLKELFGKPARPVTPEEREKAVEKFNWETVCRGFWERVA